MNIRELRTSLRQKRRALTPSQQQVAATSLLEHVTQQPWFVTGRRFAFFIASDGEIDPGPLLSLALAAGKSCFLPVLHPLRLNRLHFARYTPDTPLSPNRFGIPEPPLKRNVLAPAWSLDAIFMPLVGFDRQGHRLGMGGGFYDRTLAFTRHWPRAVPRLVGLAHHIQEVASLPAQPWDIPLHAIVTDRGVISCAARRYRSSTACSEEDPCGKPVSSPP